MTRLYKYFFRGLITVLPLALTIYLLYLFLAWTEGVALTFLRPFIGGFYVPGMGLALGILGILAIGYLVSKQRVQRFLTLVEMPFTNLPVVKSIYSSLKSFADYFSPSSKNTAQQVVVLRIPGQQLELVGLVTRRGTDGLPEGFTQGDRVAVYLPMGYMIGGYTVFVPQEWVQPIQMSVEEAMRSSLIAWMARAETGGIRPVPTASPDAAADKPVAHPVSQPAAQPAGQTAGSSVSPSVAPAVSPSVAPPADQPAATGNPANPANPRTPGNGPA
ncbi:hypothetical protein LMG26691_00707 [Achromobacter animicus]|nr:hypothetical protein LMG26691_00707 [Achromobacter animicus]